MNCGRIKIHWTFDRRAARRKFACNKNAFKRSTRFHIPAGSAISGEANCQPDLPCSRGSDADTRASGVKRAKRSGPEGNQHVAHAMGSRRGCLAPGAIGVAPKPREIPCYSRKGDINV